MEPDPRRYVCACCRTAVIICSQCDRGNRYCSKACATQVRTCRVRAAGQRYQASLRGRHAHAERQRCYRSRQANKVTHQGSPPEALPVLLPPDATSLEPDVAESGGCNYCNFCHQACGLFVRIGFMRCRVRRAPRLALPMKTCHDSDP